MKSFWQELKKPIIALAPMAGYTDSSFRILCRFYGADVVYSEMISADAICHKNKKTLAMIMAEKKECPVVFQLFGNDPKKFALAADIISGIVARAHYPSAGIDINFGCPARKIVKNNSGAVLMDKPDLAYKIIRAVCKKTFLPVSLKIRIKAKKVGAGEFLEKMKKLPWQAVMIHGRSLEQGFRGAIDYAEIGKIVNQLPDKIVIANGGITDFQTAQKIINKTGAWGVGVARGALGRPYIFREIKNSFTKNKEKITLAPSDLKNIIALHGRIFAKKNNDNLTPLRKHLIHYLKNMANACYWRQKMLLVRNSSDLRKVLREMSQ